MKTKRIVSAISFIIVILMVAACNSGQGMMHGNNSLGMDNLSYNWPQIIGGFLGGLIVGFLLGRKKR
jgi:membrane associated rhomboid family serine protease